MTNNAGRKIGGDRHEEKVYGPSWHEVYTLMGELISKFPNRAITVTLHRNTSANKQPGLVVWVSDGMGTVLGAKRFLDRSSESSKTAAGAFWTALTRAYHQLEEEAAVASGEYTQVDITDSEAGPPF